jgi:Zn-dependent metalloprotease
MMTGGPRRVGRWHRLVVAGAVAIALAIPVSISPVVGAQGRVSERALIERLPAGVVVGREPATGRVRHLGGSLRRPVWRASGRAAATPAAAARGFLRQYGTLFGVDSVARELRLTRVRTDGDRTFVRFTQRADGLAVLGGELVIQVGPRGEVISARGETSRGLLPGTRARVGAGAARRTALADARRTMRAGPERVRAGRPVLRVFDPAVMGGPLLPVARLVWQVPVARTDGAAAQDILVDAVGGRILARLDRVHAAGIRICDQRGDRVGQGTHGDRFPCDPGEGVPNAALSLITDVRVAAIAARGTLDLYQRMFGRDGVADDGQPAVMTVRHCALGGACPYANAFWSDLSRQAVFGAGWATDDVVGHELTHGVVAAESALYYYAESGAINESIADVFGEVFDQVIPVGDDRSTSRWLVGEDLTGGAVRSLADPEQFGHPARIGSSRWRTSSSDSFGVHSNSGVGNKTAWLVSQGGLFNGRSVTGLGRATMLAIWYRAGMLHLGSASDYGDLADALAQSCRDLIGFTPIDVGGAPVARGAIRAADCTQVDRAIAATEMRRSPVGGSADPPLCHGASPEMIIDEAFQEFDPDWGTTGDPPTWRVTSVYASSPPIHVAVSSPFDERDLTLVMLERFLVPTDRPVFLAFQHAYDLDTSAGTTRDAAVVERTRGLALDDWFDLGRYMTFNGYDGVVDGSNGNDLAGRRTFSGASRGYRMTKVNLSHLAGSRNKIRFRLVSDEGGAGLAWFLDDVAVYTCRDNGDATPPTVSKPGHSLPLGLLGPPLAPVLLRTSTDASDPSGLARVEWQNRSGSGDWADTSGPDYSLRPFDRYVIPSSTLRSDRVRVEDEQGNLSGWRSSSAIVRLYQETSTSPQVVKTGAWNTVAEAGASGGSVISASQAGRSVQIRVPRATDLAWVATRGPDRGRATVTVDGVIKATVDLFAPTVERARVVYTTSFNGTKAHTIKVTVSGRRAAQSTGTKVTVDAFVAITAP